LQPLEGIRILDFSTLLPGPLATLLLAEAGAEVIKIERPETGDEMRMYHPRWGTDSANFALLNRGKKSVALDLKSDDGRKRLAPLIASADVIVEQFRPGVMSRLGLDYETVSAINPRIVYCSISGYGQTGPARDVAGHDLNYIGDTGLLSLSYGDLERPVVPPALIADIAGGAYPAVMTCSRCSGALSPAAAAGLMCRWRKTCSPSCTGRSPTRMPVARDRATGRTWLPAGRLAIVCIQPVMDGWSPPLRSSNAFGRSSATPSD
jgi:hypothetical protein